MENGNQNIEVLGLLPKVFAGEATPGEKQMVQDWQSASQANRDEYNAFARLWDLTGNAAGTEDIDLNAEWRKMETVITPSGTRRTGFAVMLRIAAAVAVVSSLAFIGWRLSGIHTEKAPATALASTELPDGSRVFLNAGSKLTYRKGFGTIHRHLRLKGEAYFEVKKNAMPFITKAGEASVLVTGTRFNIRAYSAKPEVRVTVAEGSVSLYESGQPLKKVSLTAGETGIYDKSLSTLKKQPAGNMNDLAWKTRIIDFQDTPLVEVAEILMNTYHVSVTLDPVIRDCGLTVHFENQELDSLLHILQSTLDLTITREGRHIFITGKGC